MNSAEIIKLRDDAGAETAPASEVDRLLGERAAVIAELARLATIDSPVREAEMAVQAVDRAIAGLDEAERAETRDWAVDGVGSPPAARNEERAGLVRRRLELQSDLDSAKNRAAAIEPRRTALNGEIGRVDRLIFAEKLRLAVEDARRFDAEAHERAKAVGEPLGRVIGLKLLLAGEMMNAADVKGDKAAVRLIGEAIEILSDFKMPELGAEQAALPGHMNTWREALR